MRGAGNWSSRPACFSYVGCMEEQPRRAAAQRDTTRPAAATRPDLIHRELARVVVRACHIVRQELGAGYLESVYEAALTVVLRRWGMKVDRQRSLEVRFWGEVVGSFRADLVVDDVLLVELKAAAMLAKEHDAQVLNYLAGSGLRVALLVNFGKTLDIKRLVR
jgi:GxxExxY protein